MVLAMAIKHDSHRKLKICMLLPYYYKPDMLIYARQEIFSYITHFGHQVTWVISSEEDHQPQPLPLNGIKVYTIPYQHHSSRDWVLFRIFNRINYALRRARFILNIFRREKYDLIFVRNDVFDGLTAAYIKRRYKIPFVFELANPLEQEWETYKIMQQKPLPVLYLFTRFSKFLNMRLLHQADLVLPINQWLKDDLTKHKGIPGSKVMPISVGVDAKEFRGRDGREIIEEYQLSSSRVVIYEGVLDKIRNLSILLQAFSKVKRERQGVKLLIVGDGDDKENLQNLAHELGIQDEIIFTGRVPQSEVPDFIAAADIGVSPIPPLSFYKLSSPIKLFEYMAMAKPVVANEEILEQKDVLEQSGGGILVPFTPEALAQAIVELVDNPQKAAEMGQKGREWVMKNRSYEILARQVEEKYLELVGNDPERR